MTSIKRLSYVAMLAMMFVGGCFFAKSRSVHDPTARALIHRR